MMTSVNTLFRLHEDFGEVGLGEELLHKVDDFGGLELFDDGAAIGVHVNSPTLLPPHGVEPEAVFGFYQLVEGFEQTLLGTLEYGGIDALCHREKGILHHRKHGVAFLWFHLTIGSKARLILIFLAPRHVIAGITAVCGAVFFSDNLIVEQVKYLAGCLGDNLMLE